VHGLMKSSPEASERVPSLQLGQVVRRGGDGEGEGTYCPATAWSKPTKSPTSGRTLAIVPCLVLSSLALPCLCVPVPVVFPSIT